jgi:hypothetical protein
VSLIVVANGIDSEVIEATACAPEEERDEEQGVVWDEREREKKKPDPPNAEEQYKSSAHALSDNTAEEQYHNASAWEARERKAELLRCELERIDKVGGKHSPHTNKKAKPGKNGDDAQELQTLTMS